MALYRSVEPNGILKGSDSAGITMLPHTNALTKFLVLRLAPYISSSLIILKRFILTASCMGVSPSCKNYKNPRIKREQKKYLIYLLNCL